MRSTGAALLILFVLLAGAGLSQAPTSILVGAWHSDAAPPLPQTVLIFSADGYYVQLTIPPGRRPIKNDFDHRTREELLKEFGGVRGSYGSWKVEGAKLIRQSMATVEPAAEGKQATADFRIEGDILILKGESAQNESRYRRMK